MFSPAQVQQFSADGYTVCQDILTSDEAANLLRETDLLTSGNTRSQHDATRMEMEPNQPPDGTAVRRLYEPCTYYPIFKDLAESDQLLDCVEQLLGHNLLYHYSKLNMKPAEIGSAVEWHQDLSYYPLTNRDSLAVLFYLDETSRQNGALQMLPGHHNGRLLDHELDGYFQGRITEDIDDGDAVLVEGEAGTAIFMHGMTPHASAINTSDRPRRTLILSYRAADAYSIYCSEKNKSIETHVRLVRGERSAIARFDQHECRVPRYKNEFLSLYDLQARSKRGEAS